MARMRQGLVEIYKVTAKGKETQIGWASIGAGNPQLERWLLFQPHDLPIDRKAAEGLLYKWFDTKTHHPLSVSDVCALPGANPGDKIYDCTVDVTGPTTCS